MHLGTQSLDAEVIPYIAELSFGLSEGPGKRDVIDTIYLEASRKGKWKAPDLRAIAAVYNPLRRGAVITKPTGDASILPRAGFAHDRI